MCTICGPFVFLGAEKKEVTKMSVPAAFLGVVLIWSTTPLAIQWSSEGWGYLFGVAGRMVLGTAVCFILLRALKYEFPWHRAARHTYLAAAVGIYGAMLSVYWGAQFVPSGLIAVFYGLVPMVTAVMAAVWLREQSLTFGKMAGVVLAFAGLLTIFGADILLRGQAWAGAIAVLLSVFLHSASAVWIKRIDAGLPGLTVSTGGLLISMPLFLLTWLVFDGTVPAAVLPRAGMALLYLVVIATAVGFTLYYYLLKNIEASQTGLITLLPPVLALMLGQVLNGEHIPHAVWLGSALIVAGLVMHLFVDRCLGRLFAVRAE
jgi:drug/metabolite transporter (DMT)-like permease